MENMNSYTDIAISENIYENFAEDRIEQEILIPDYQPSARKIVECRSEASVLNRSSADDSVTLDGVCIWTLIYLSDEDDAMHAITCERPFSISFAVGKMRGSVKYKIRTQNTICKLHSAQKATCKTTVCVAAKIEDKKSMRVLAGTDDGNVQLQTVRQNILEPQERSEKEFKIVCEMPVKSDADFTVCRCMADIAIEDSRCEEDKIVISGVCYGKAVLLYKNKCAAACPESQTPFTQILDAPGVTSGCHAAVSCKVVEKDAAVSEEDGEKTVFLSVTVQADAAVYCPKTADLSIDAYHPKHLLDVQKTELEICTDLFTVEIGKRINERVHLNTDNMEVLYTDATAEIDKIAAHENTLVLEGNAVVGFTFVKDGDVIHNDFSLPFQATKTLDSKFRQLRCEARVRTEDLGFIILGDNEIEVDLNIRITLSVFDVRKQDVISEIAVREETTEQLLKTPLVLYYGTKGESLWEIAKKYLVPLDVVMTSNGLTQDILERDTMLFIGRH